MKRRKCFVELGKTDLFGKIKSHDRVKGYFYGVFQYAQPYAALIQGEQSGQISYPVAVVEIDGKLQQIDLKRVSFVEEKEAQHDS